VKCNFNLDRVTTLPDWWNEERDTSFMDNALAAAAQRAKDTEELERRNKVNNYLTYGGTGLILICSCLLISVLMLSLKR
jgi:hypothetical protein